MEQLKLHQGCHIYGQNVNKIGSIGIPIPGSKMEIIKPNNKKIGEILFKGSNVSLGYANLKI